MDENQRREEMKNKIYTYLKQGMYKKDAAENLDLPDEEEPSGV
jgi:hypothetical protein